MLAERKKLFSLILLAALAAFSTASISTTYYYYQSAQISGLHCHESNDGKGKKGLLGYVTRGILNQSKNKNAVAICPVDLQTSQSFTVNTVVFAQGAKSRGRILCELIEIDTLGGSVIARYPNSTVVGSNSTALLTWYDIEASMFSSIFTQRCELLPGTGIISTSVAASRN